MQYIILLMTLYASIILILAFLNLKLSIALYLSYLILVPYLQFNIVGVSLSYNLVNTVLLFSFFYQWNKKNTHINYKILIPFLIFILFLFVFTFFEPSTPFEIQMNYLRLTAMQTSIVSLIIWNIAKDDLKMITYIKWALIVSISIACVYGIFLMNLGGLNPYTSFLANYYNVLDAAETLSDYDSRLSFSTAKNIQSTMTHPMRWALNLCFLIVLFFVFWVKEKKKTYLFLIVLLLFNLLISGVRTGLVSIAIGVSYYLIFNLNFKTLLYSTIIFLSLNTIVSENEDLLNILNSVTDINGTKSDVQGSSIAMRIEQLDGCFKEIEGEELFGKGFGWTSYYQSIKGDHPIILAFESLIFVILCNNGILGIFVWGFFFVLLFNLHRKIIQSKKDILFLDIFVLVYIFYAIGTGEYGYLPIFYVYYSVLFAYLFYFQSKDYELKNYNAKF